MFACFNAIAATVLQIASCSAMMAFGDAPARPRAAELPRNHQPTTKGCREASKTNRANFMHVHSPLAFYPILPSPSPPKGFENIQTSTKTNRVRWLAAGNLPHCPCFCKVLFFFCARSSFVFWESLVDPCTRSWGSNLGPHPQPLNSLVRTSVCNEVACGGSNKSTKPRKTPSEMQAAWRRNLLYPAQRTSWKLELAPGIDQHQEFQGGRVGMNDAQCPLFGIGATTPARSITGFWRLSLEALTEPSSMTLS